MQVTGEAQQTDFQGDSPKANKWRDMDEWKQTPLLRKMSNADKNWLLKECVDRWQFHWNKLSAWRMKMAKWERQSEQDFTDRRTEQDESSPSSHSNIFNDQNDTLGLVSGFCDFHYAQAKDDLFGTRPWLAVNPEGKADIDLAENLSRHCQWKFSHSNLEETMLDALKVSTWGGTCFAKAGWERDAESFFTTVYEAVDKRTGEPILREDGSAVRSKEEVDSMIAEGYDIDPEAVEWKASQVEDVQTVYANVRAGLIDYNDIAFKKDACDLDLKHTDVFLRFRTGLLDAIEKYEIPESKKNILMGAYTGYDDTARDHRDEQGDMANESFEERANPTITLIEGFIRIKPSINLPMARVHVIFSADMHHLFKADYLANVTPGGILPVFPIRINKIPNRIFGKGYFEKFENFNNAVDRQYNTVTFRNRFSQHVYTAVKPSALKDGGEGVDAANLDPRTPFELAEGQTMDDFLQFKSMPDNNNRSIELMNSMMQMGQMISGITSAAQGELKGVPSNNTATGVKDLQSRGATIIKSPIDEQKNDIQEFVEFCVHVLYANHDTDETFTWSEGRNAELLTIKANDVAELRANVTLTMSQSQNTRKIESAQAAIGILQGYLQLPEIDKVTAKPIFEQALSALGFHNATDVLRDAVVDLASLAELAPPDLQPIIMQMAQQMEMPAPTGEEAVMQPESQDLAPVETTPQL